MTEVTISDLHNVTGVSRATFYRLFDTPEDVLRYMCDRFKQELVSNLTVQKFAAPRDLLIFAVRFAMTNHALLEALARNHLSDMLDEVHNATVRFLSDQFHIFDEFDQTETQYAQSLFHSVMTAALMLWVQRGRKETPEQLMEYVKKYSTALDVLLRMA